MSEKAVKSLLNILGYGLPETGGELEMFNRIHQNHIFHARAISIDPAKIMGTTLKGGIKITNIDYHKRSVLAAEIIFQLQEEWTLGHLKLQKLLYLCQNLIQMQLHTNFSKQAMGPYDPRLMRSIDKQMENHKWFKFQSGNKGPKYLKLENIGSHREWYERYFENEIPAINLLIERFRKTSTRQIELIATLYACWVESPNISADDRDQVLLDKLYAWSKDKQKFSKEEILNCINWMLEAGIHPKEQRN